MIFREVRFFYQSVSLKLPSFKGQLNFMKRTIQYDDVQGDGSPEVSSDSVSVNLKIFVFEILEKHFSGWCLSFLPTSDF